MPREILNDTVVNYAYTRHLEYRLTWNVLYKMFLKLYHINLKVRARNRKMRPIEYAEKHGFINLLLGLALIIYAAY